MLRRYPLLLALAAALAVPGAAFAQALDTPTFQMLGDGHGKFTLRVTAGPSGTPNGFALYWMTLQDYTDYGSQWPDQLSYPGLAWAQFTGTPTLNVFAGQPATFILGPNQFIDVEIGDLEDETGVNTNFPQELTHDGMDYVVCAFAIGGAGGARSGYSVNAEGATTLMQDCTHTIGYWKNHPSAWPVTGLTLGSVSYTQTELLQILNTPAQGNGLVSLAKQLIGAKLSAALGAETSQIASQIAAADALIGALVVPTVGAGYLQPSGTSGLTNDLDDFNNGRLGGDCVSTPAQSATFGRLKTLYR
jgi:hypothetical protein